MKISLAYTMPFSFIADWGSVYKIPFSFHIGLASCLHENVLPRPAGITFVILITVERIIFIVVFMASIFVFEFEKCAK